jgi:hypothetical protein
MNSKSKVIIYAWVNDETTGLFAAAAAPSGVDRLKDAHSLSTKEE